MPSVTEMFEWPRITIASRGETPSFFKAARCTAGRRPGVSAGLSVVGAEFAADRRLQFAQDASGPGRHLDPRLIRAEPPGVQATPATPRQQQVVIHSTCPVNPDR